MFTKNRNKDKVLWNKLLNRDNNVQLSLWIKSITKCFSDKICLQFVNLIEDMGKMSPNFVSNCWFLSNDLLKFNTLFALELIRNCQWHKDLFNYRRISTFVRYRCNCCIFDCDMLHWWTLYCLIRLLDAFMALEKLFCYNN